MNLQIILHQLKITLSKVSLNNVSPKYKDVDVQAKLQFRKIMRNKYIQNVTVMRDAYCATKQNTFNRSKK